MKNVVESFVLIRTAIQTDMRHLFVLVTPDNNITDFEICFDDLLKEQNQGRVLILVAVRTFEIVGCTVAYLHKYLDGQSIVNCENFFIKQLKQEYKNEIIYNCNRKVATWASNHDANIYLRVSLDEE